MEVFFGGGDRGVSSCKLYWNYFLPWVIDMPLYGITNTSTLPVCANISTYDKSSHNRYNVTI